LQQRHLARLLHESSIAFFLELGQSQSLGSQPADKLSWTQW